MLSFSVTTTTTTHLLSVLLLLLFFFYWLVSRLYYTRQQLSTKIKWRAKKKFSFLWIYFFFLLPPQLRHAFLHLPALLRSFVCFRFTSIYAISRNTHFDDIPSNHNTHAARIAWNASPPQESLSATHVRARYSETDSVKSIRGATTPSHSASATCATVPHKPFR